MFYGELSSLKAVQKRYIDMISSKHKFVFVHINCCAGSRIESALNNFGSWQPEPKPGLFHATQHYNAGEYLTAFPESKDYYKFAIVRNPWARMVTYYVTHPKFHHGFHNVKWLFKRWVQKLGVTDEAQSFYDYSRMYSSSYSWIHQNSSLQVDHVGKFEDIGDEFNEVCSKLKIDAKLPHKNKSLKKRDFREFYDDESAEIIANRFKRDIDTFGYRFDSI